MNLFSSNLLQGSTYSIVPYVSPNATGSVAGLVGAGGNAGGVVFLIMIQEWNYRSAFKVMGVCVICSAFLSFFISIKGQNGIFCGSRTPDEVEVVIGDIPTEKETSCKDITGVTEFKTASTSEILGDKK